MSSLSRTRESQMRSLLPFLFCPDLSFRFFALSAAWEKQRAKPKIVTESEVRESPPSDPTLVCPLCTKLFTQAVQTPCCQTNYCEECIQAHLLEHDFVCPNCDEKIGSLDRLVENGEMRERVERYIVDEIERRKFEEEGQGKASR